MITDLPTSTCTVLPSGGGAGAGEVCAAARVPIARRKHRLCTNLEFIIAVSLFPSRLHRICGWWISYPESPPAHRWAEPSGRLVSRLSRPPREVWAEAQFGRAVPHADPRFSCQCHCATQTGSFPGCWRVAIFANPRGSTAESPRPPAAVYLVDPVQWSVLQSRPRHPAARSE